MKHTIQVTFARPDHTCRKTVTLNGGPFHGYTIGLVDLGSLTSRLMAISDECQGLSTPTVGHPHRLSYDFHTTEAKVQAEEADEFTLPSLEEMSAHMDAEMARLVLANFCEPELAASAPGAPFIGLPQRFIDGGCQKPADKAPAFNPPSFDEMSAHMDAEMARLDIAPRTTADAWGAAA